ncbi:MAG TPA: ROK family protein [Tepidisphaeraceae bacterium]|jgi:predicted NBD/HSP70 family sugar kinase|nr:ROK family protein [Tepidisphaeraceae bacterium]
MFTLGIDIGGSSVKTAAFQDDHFLSTAQSPPHNRPNTTQLIESIRKSLPPSIKPDRLGLCLPGLYDATQRKITQSVNVPGLVGPTLDDLISKALGTQPPPLQIFTDALAAAHDILHMKKLDGRVLVISLGTGIGAAILDNGKPLHVDGPSPGHIGQVDVTIEGHTAIGPDGGAGSLEGYMGAAALIKKYGDVATALKTFRGFEPPLRALARAIRIAHAIYRPQHVVLAGGIGIRMAHLAEPLHALVSTHLSSIARPNWTLTCGDSDFHAARGAARLAANAN